MKQSTNIYILLSYVLLFVDARRNFDIHHKKCNTLKDYLRNTLLKVKLEILWKISNKQENILPDFNR